VPDTENGKVTLAVLGEITRAIKEDTGKIKDSVEAIEDRVRAVEIEQGRNQVQHKLLAGTQLAAIITAVGAFFGR